jgi:hypothetical protein
VAPSFFPLTGSFLEAIQAVPPRRPEMCPAQQRPYVSRCPSKKNEIPKGADKNTGSESPGAVLAREKNDRNVNKRLKSMQSSK